MAMMLVTQFKSQASVVIVTRETVISLILLIHREITLQGQQFSQEREPILWHRKW